MSSLSFGLYLNNRGAVFLQDYSLDHLLDQAAEAEALGFHSVWAGDSLLAKPRYDPIVVLTAVAARTAGSSSAPASCRSTSATRCSSPWNGPLWT